MIHKGNSLKLHPQRILFACVLLILGFQNCELSSLKGLENHSLSNPLLQSLDLESTTPSTRKSNEITSINSSEYHTSSFQLTSGTHEDFGPFTLSMQTDRNLVLYLNGVPIWNTKTSRAHSCTTCTASLQSDGNLVLYDEKGTPYWDSKTQGTSPSLLKIKTTFPYLQIVRGEQVQWSSSPLEKFKPLDIESLRLVSPKQYRTEPLILDQTTSHDGAVVKGLALGNSKHDGPCLVIRNLKNVTIETNEIFDCHSDRSNYFQPAVVIENSSNIRIIGNYIYNNQGVGVYARFSNNIVVQGNQFYQIGGGVVAEDSSQIQILKNRFMNMLERPNGTSNFAQLIRVQGGGNHINCNVGLNEASAVRNAGDIINVYASFGLANDPIIVYGNRIMNSLGVNTAQPGLSSAGVQSIDGGRGAHMKVIANSVVHVGGGSLQVTGGDGIEVAWNRIYSARPKDQWTSGISAVSFWEAPDVWHLPGSYCRNVTIHNNLVSLNESQQPAVWVSNFGNNWPLCQNVVTNLNDEKAAINESILDAVAPECAQ